jgi:prepilin-type N-terminal cleavage/methylation domain-containing protein
MMTRKNHSGFSLVEMAVVLMIIALLIGAFMGSLTAQLDQTRISEARRDIVEIKEALLGHVIVNGFFPCPDTNDDGLSETCANTNASATSGGNIPWATLGLKATDPWGSAYQYRVNNAFTAAFNLTTTGNGAGIIRICTTNACALTESSNVPLVVFSFGKNGGIQPPVDADELENADADRDFVNHDFVEGGFDDLVMWISTNVLMNRMVTVGKLP